MLILTLASLAHAQRPTEGGLFSFDASDVVASVDSPGGTVRVWYSTDGPNLVKTDDDDANGVPDFAEEVGAAAEDVLIVYAEKGFRAPLSDEGRGGSDAMDVYLVDFGGNADGNYSAEVCSSSPRQCSGFFVMENDFEGYGYGSLSTAIRVLTSHELFHAVQAAYDADEEVWFSEGTAVWAEELYEEESNDFLAFCDAYLDDTGRSLNEPPAGPVPTFAYATALWWWYLSDQYGDDVLIELLEATESGDDLLLDMEGIEVARGGSLRVDFATFAQWNLATGRYSGAMASYPFAENIGPPRAEESGAAISDDNRYYPLAATYYTLEHPGGEVWFATAADAPELAFSLHGTTADGDVTDAVATVAGSATPALLGDLPAGDYWLVGSNPTLAEDSTKVLTCLGSAADVAACAPAISEDTGTDTAGDDTGGDAPPEGCGCATPAHPGGALVVALAGLAVAGGRRRRA
ncbi:MAG: MYXO-CTERM sorting domain-containing protein [Pseudomonadota bacterium]|nr:MYXO-CTERM sorting domain-containing protein [Pseudomonadota bacterium]